MSFVQDITARNMNIKTVANTLGSRHPFILAEEVEKKSMIGEDVE